MVCNDRISIHRTFGMACYKWEKVDFLIRPNSELAFGYCKNQEIIFMQLNIIMQKIDVKHDNELCASCPTYDARRRQLEVNVIDNQMADCLHVHLTKVLIRIMDHIFNSTMRSSTDVFKTGSAIR